MAMNVFVNGRKAACKSASGTLPAAFPDVCLSPPSPPAGPVPIPYPNTAKASDTTGGSTSVLFHGKMVCQEDKSCFSTSMGDEAATKSLGMGVITHQHKGKAYFVSWSMDVLVEGKGVPRHLDMMTANHGSVPGNTPAWPYLDPDVATSPAHSACKKDQEKENKACKNYQPHKADGPDVCDHVNANVSKKTEVNTEQKADDLAKRVINKDQKKPPKRVTPKRYEQASECMKARRCSLAPIAPRTDEDRCCSGQTAHHLIPASSFFDVGRGGREKVKNRDLHRTSVPLAGSEKYQTGRAPCVCVEGTNQNHGSHGRVHALTTFLTEGQASPPQDLPLDAGTISSFAGKPGEVQMAGRAGVSGAGNAWAIKARTIRYDQARDMSVAAMMTAFPESPCDPGCLIAQLDAYHVEACGIKPDMKIKAVFEGDQPVSKQQINTLTKNYESVLRTTDAPATAKDIF